MAGEVINDAQVLREFSRTLKNFSQLLSESMGSLRNKTSQLGDSWRDDQFETFESELQRTQAILREFVTEAERVVPRLDHFADGIERVRQIGM